MFPERRATGVSTIQKALKDNVYAPAIIETDDDRTYFLLTIPCREGFEEKTFNPVSGVDDALEDELVHRLGQNSVQVQERVNQSVIVSKKSGLDIYLYKCLSKYGVNLF